MFSSKTKFLLLIVVVVACIQSSTSAPESSRKRRDAESTTAASSGDSTTAAPATKGLLTGLGDALTPLPLVGYLVAQILYSLGGVLGRFISFLG